MNGGADMVEVFGRLLLLVGLAIAGLGGLILLFSRLGLSWPTLPGDIVIRRPGMVVYLPIVSCLVASVVLSLLLTLVLGIMAAFFRR